MSSVSSPPMPPLRTLDHARFVLRRFLELTTCEQLAVHLAIQAYLSVELRSPLRRELEIELRLRALDCLHRASQALRLEPGIAPRARQYRGVWRTIGLEMNATAIARAFDTWSQAVAVYEGGRARESAAQRALRRALAGRTRLFEDYIAGVRYFLATKPASTSGRDYDAFVAEWNDALDDGRLPLVKAGTILRQTSLTWDEVLAVAEGTLTRAEALASRRRGRSSLGDWGPLVGLQGVAAILDRGSQSIAELVYRPDFPPPVVRREAGRSQVVRIWRRSDIEAYMAGTYRRGVRPWELQKQVVLGVELARLIGIGHGTLHHYLCSRRHLVPPPAGRASGAYYWWRVDVMEWLAARADRP